MTLTLSTMLPSLFPKSSHKGTELERDAFSTVMMRERAVNDELDCYRLYQLDGNGRVFGRAGGAGGAGGAGHTGAPLQHGSRYGGSMDAEVRASDGDGDGNNVRGDDEFPSLSMSERGTDSDFDSMDRGDTFEGGIEVINALLAPGAP
jgi:hypothetical protein